MVLDSLNLEGVEYMTQADLKLLMIMVGKSGGRPKFGCPFCSASVPYQSEGELYSLHDLMDLHSQFIESGANPKTQKDFQNVVHPPLIVASPDQLILGTLALPELHLLLCTVDKLLSGIEDNVFPTK